MRVLHVITRLIAGGAQLNTLRTAILHRQAGKYRGQSLEHQILPSQTRDRMWMSTPQSA